MVNVFITVDVEVWCSGWQDIDRKFPKAFKSYIYGSSSQGDYGLPFQIKLLNESGLKGVFFVEPLFAARFGTEPLTEIVEMLQTGNQEVQMHMHPEWVDEAREPLLPNITEKRQNMNDYSYEEQSQLIKKGLELFEAAGESSINAFRAGGFGADNNTLKALRANNIQFDSSYNFTQLNRNCDIDAPEALLEPIKLEGLYEYPMTYYYDYPGHLRHLQVGACSYKELVHILEKAEKAGIQDVVILSHSFELMTRNRLEGDKTLTKRFANLCEFLAKNTDRFRTLGFYDIEGRESKQQPKVPVSSIFLTLQRMIEQNSINAYNKKIQKQASV